MNRRQFVCRAGAAALSPDVLAASENARALTGDTLRLAGEEIRLADILAPELLDPYGAQAKLELEMSLSGGAPLVKDAAERDRWSRRVARVFTGRAAAQSLQEALVGAGAARVRPETEDAAFIRGLLRIEGEAREAKRGLWAHWRYRVAEAASAEGTVGAFNLVEGVVLQAVVRGPRTYLNFGEDYRSDFTVTAPSRRTRQWAKDGLDLLSLAGASVRVRGYVAWINGPSIELEHSQQVEILTAPAPAIIATEPNN